MTRTATREATRRAEFTPEACGDHIWVRRVKQLEQTESGILIAGRKRDHEPIVYGVICAIGRQAAEEYDLAVGHVVIWAPGEASPIKLEGMQFTIMRGLSVVGCFRDLERAKRAGLRIESEDLEFELPTKV